MEIKNGKLQQTIDSLESIKYLTLGGELVLSAIELKSQLKEKSSKIEETKKQLVESFCAKNENGPITVTQNFSDGRSAINYTFDTPEKESQCKLELLKIDEVSIDYFVNKCIDRDYLVGMNLSMKQAEALLLFVG